MDLMNEYFRITAKLLASYRQERRAKEVMGNFLEEKIAFRQERLKDAESYMVSSLNIKSACKNNGNLYSKLENVSSQIEADRVSFTSSSPTDSETDFRMLHCSSKQDLANSSCFNLNLSTKDLLRTKSLNDFFNSCVENESGDEIWDYEDDEEAHFNEARHAISDSAIAIKVESASDFVQVPPPSRTPQEAHCSCPEHSKTEHLLGGIVDAHRIVSDFHIINNQNVEVDQNLAPENSNVMNNDGDENMEEIQPDESDELLQPEEIQRLEGRNALIVPETKKTRRGECLKWTSSTGHIDVAKEPENFDCPGPSKSAAEWKPLHPSGFQTVYPVSGRDSPDYVDEEDYLGSGDDGRFQIQLADTQSVMSSPSPVLSQSAASFSSEGSTTENVESPSGSRKSEIRLNNEITPTPSDFSVTGVDEEEDSLSLSSDDCDKNEQHSRLLDKTHAETIETPKSTRSTFATKH